MVCCNGYARTCARGKWDIVCEMCGCGPATQVLQYVPSHYIGRGLLLEWKAAKHQLLHDILSALVVSLTMVSDLNRTVYTS